MSTVLRARAHRAAQRRLQELHVVEANRIRRNLGDTEAKDLTIVVRKKLREQYPYQFAKLYAEELAKVGLSGRASASSS